jgi:hypothetical protein
VYLVFGGLTLLLVLAALIDIITRDDSGIRHLPKITWVFIVILLPLIGSLVWFAVGRDWSVRGEAMPFGDPRRHDAAAQRMRPIEPVVDDAAIEAELRRAEREARLRRLEAAVEAKRRERGEGAP